jgi:hypothetical protein
MEIAMSEAIYKMRWMVWKKWLPSFLTMVHETSKRRNGHRGIIREHDGECMLVPTATPDHGL